MGIKNLRKIIVFYPSYENGGATKILQNIVKKFEDAFLEFNLEKIKTVGDAIVAVSGLSSFDTQSVKNCVDCSYKLRELASNLEIPWHLHFGIHFGSQNRSTLE